MAVKLISTSIAGGAATQAAKDAKASADLAKKWATEQEDVPVAGGEFSAYHWAQKSIGRAPLNPENFYSITHPDMSIAVQACIDAAGNYPSSITSKPVLFSDFYSVSVPILVRPFVQIMGIGLGRCGLKSTVGHTAGPLLDADTVVNTSSIQDVSISGFSLIGTLASGAAYGLRVQGQKNSVLSQLRIDGFNTTSPAAQFLGLCQMLALKDVQFANNRFHQKIAATGVGTFPTTILHQNCAWLGGLVNTGASIEIADANAISFDKNCVMQDNGNKTTVLITGGATRMATHSHVFDSVYIEENGGGQSGSNTWRLVGLSGNKVDNIKIITPRLHGVAPNGRHVYLQHTDGFSLPDTYQPSHAMVTDGGNNANYDINAVNVGACDLQTVKYTESTIVFTAADSVISRSGPLNLQPQAQATGRYRVTYSRPIITNSEFIEAEATDATGEFGLNASSLAISTTACDVKVTQPTYSGAGPSVVMTPVAPLRMRVTVSGILA